MNFLFLLFALAAAGSTPSPTPVMHYDVLISAGHEGRPASCSSFPKHKCNLGAAGEREQTPIVADEATKVLRAFGYSVAREPADFAGRFDVKAAIFIHFDGSDRPCSSGASIGYHTGESAPAARLWRAEYSKVFPFPFKADNFTLNLRDYYGFRQVHASSGALVLELGELTCPAQNAWLGPRLLWEGDFIAHVVSQLVGTKIIPQPAMYTSVIKMK